MGGSVCDPHHVAMRDWLGRRGISIHWAWVPAGVFGFVRAWMQGGLALVAVVLIIAVALTAFVTRNSKRN